MLRANRSTRKKVHVFLYSASRPEQYQAEIPAEWDSRRVPWRRRGQRWSGRPCPSQARVIDVAVAVEGVGDLGHGVLEAKQISSETGLQDQDYRGMMFVFCSDIVFLNPAWQ